MIATCPFVPFSVLSRNTRGTRGTSRDGALMGLRDSADPHGRVAVGFELQHPGCWPVSLDDPQVPDRALPVGLRASTTNRYPW